VTLSPDEIVYFTVGPLKITATLVFTWVTMAVLVFLSWLATRNLKVEGAVTRPQHMAEAIIEFLLNEIKGTMQLDARPYLPFVGTLFLFVALPNVLGIIPGFQQPTGSLTTTAALAVAVLLAVPVFGIARVGLRRYLRSYLEPTPFMLPFTILGEITRTLSLAVRLFGNIMSGTVIVAILMSIAPLFFPVIMQAFGLLVGLLQAYIFAVLAMVYIASAASGSDKRLNRHGAPTATAPNQGGTT
jgi:F-type H+-transporting ATPase subunit a